MPRIGAGLEAHAGTVCPLGEAVGGEVRRAAGTVPSDLKEFDLLIVGSPTRGGFPSPDVDSMLKKLPVLEGIQVAAFDTCTKTTIFGCAAPKIAKHLKKAAGVFRRRRRAFFCGSKGVPYGRRVGVCGKLGEK